MRLFLCISTLQTLQLSTFDRPRWITVHQIVIVRTLRGWICDVLISSKEKGECFAPHPPFFSFLFKRRCCTPVFCNLKLRYLIVGSLKGFEKVPQILKGWFHKLSILMYFQRFFEFSARSARIKRGRFFLIRLCAAQLSVLSLSFVIAYVWSRVILYCCFVFCPL